MVVAPDLVSELKMFLRDKGIDFKVLITNIQVRDSDIREKIKLSKKEENEKTDIEDKSINFYG